MAKVTKKIEILSLKTVREKLAYLLLYNSSSLNENKISLLVNKISVSREAVSREISKMQIDGVIRKKDNYIEILDKEGLESYLG
ncbi:helix-turn-helix domain-containing protein [Thiospirochaeta perfilievii]|uniref:Helix-turn-helix domain-containing protein n=1 Tax=Thiospirochaeta perfilievii TaxID=252967 RepID=A0A5C1QCS9_9SPIO|nr:helix-turn-helix domain-containing protein [Thiospirochaeta perfilievii]